MAFLRGMPQIQIAQAELAPYGRQWQDKDQRFSKPQQVVFGELFDDKVGEALATMLGYIPVVTPNRNALIPAQPDCVEVGPCRIVINSFAIRTNLSRMGLAASSRNFTQQWDLYVCVSWKHGAVRTL